ncbi:VanW family protein [Nocardioides xinjiangensis]|uniref:VanW family protein n=1 Tax=Nocardioides xinjiangensis TaxID=2817376 RepID=UPI0027DE3CD5|nr:VanW family protein [Nocardioides sp. SYSU D00778]
MNPGTTTAPVDPLELPPRLSAPPRLTQRHPWMLPVAMVAHRARRRTQWVRDAWSGGVVWASRHDASDLPVRVKQHGSLLLRELDPARMHLQHNKVTNLRLAARRLDGIVVGPGETFSFNRVVGSCTRRKGYLDGMTLADGAAGSGVGGGICQLANLVHWMVLHSPLTVVERSEHSFDPFPDRGRVLPWGVGCSIVYNYVDLVVRNDTDRPFQLRAWVGERYLHGQLRTDERLPHSYRVEARGEQFLRRDGRVFRRNQVWRRVLDRRSGEQVGEELVRTNCALVVYEPGPGVDVIDVD